MHQIHRSSLAAATALAIATACHASTITLVPQPGGPPGMAGFTQFTTPGSSALFATGASDSVNALAFDSSGNLYEADSGGNVYKINPQGAASLFTNYAVTGVNNPHALAVDAGGNLFVSGSGNSTGLVVKVATGGASSTALFDSSDPAYGITFDSGNNLYLASFGNIYKIAPNGTTTTFATGTTGTGLAFGPSGHLYETESSTQSIKKFAPDGSSFTTYATGLSLFIGDIAVDQAENVYYASTLNPFVYQALPGNNNVSDLTYPTIYPAYHPAALSTAPEPGRAMLLLVAGALGCLRRRRRGDSRRA